MDSENQVKVSEEAVEVVGTVEPVQLPPLEVSDRPFMLYAKLARVMKELERVPKRGWNRQHEYFFATDADVLDAIRGHLGALGVAFLPRMLSVTQTVNGKAVNTLVRFEFTFACADTGQTWTSEWEGESVDWSDKGISKAATLALKYFLLKTFMISTGDMEEDPDAESPERGDGKSTQQKGSKPTPQRQQKPQQQNKATGQQSPPAGQTTETWATAGNLKQLQAKLESEGILWTEIPSLITAITNVADLDAWGKAFPTGAAAAAAIRGAFATRQQNSGPAKPKNGALDKPTLNHQWQQNEIDQMDALCEVFWDSSTDLPMDATTMLTGMGHIAWSEFKKGPSEARVALRSYAIQQNLPFVAHTAKFRTQYTELGNDLISGRLYGRDQLRELSQGWFNYADSWENGKIYNLTADGYQVIATWTNKDKYLNVDDVTMFEVADPFAS